MVISKIALMAACGIFVFFIINRNRNLKKEVAEHNKLVDGRLEIAEKSMVKSDEELFKEREKKKTQERKKKEQAIIENAERRKRSYENTSKIGRAHV